MPDLILYEKPTCSTCRRVRTLLEERGVRFRTVDLFATPLDEATLGELLRLAGLRPRDVVRVKEPSARELDLDDDPGTLRALAAAPGLVQRPLVRWDERVVLARPPERVLELLDERTPPTTASSS